MGNLQEALQRTQQAIDKLFTSAFVTLTSPVVGCCPIRRAQRSLGFQETVANGVALCTSAESSTLTLPSPATTAGEGQKAVGSKK
jgi:hypothetical protein